MSEKRPIHLDVVLEHVKTDHKKMNVKQTFTPVWIVVQNIKNQCQHIPATELKFAVEQKQQQQTYQPHGGYGY